LYALAAKIVRMSPALSAAIVCRDGTKQLHCPGKGTLYRALSADASTAYGLSPVLTVFDELGQVRGPRSKLYEALETATAGQLAPLSIVISTQAVSDADLLSILIDDALGGLIRASYAPFTPRRPMPIRSPLQRSGPPTRRSATFKIPMRC
jgi:hypothetical protein